MREAWFAFQDMKRCYALWSFWDNVPLYFLPSHSTPSPQTTTYNIRLTLRHSSQPLHGLGVLTKMWTEEVFLAFRFSSSHFTLTVRQSVSHWIIWECVPCSLERPMNETSPALQAFSLSFLFVDIWGVSSPRAFQLMWLSLPSRTQACLPGVCNSMFCLGSQQRLQDSFFLTKCCLTTHFKSFSLRDF